MRRLKFIYSLVISLIILAFSLFFLFRILGFVELSAGIEKFLDSELSTLFPILNDIEDWLKDAFHLTIEEIKYIISKVMERHNW